MSERSVYFIQAGEAGPIKIGCAANPERRLAALQTGSGDTLVLLATRRGGHDEERALHRLLAPHRVRGEWFAPHPDVLKAVGAATAPKPPDMPTEAVLGPVKDRAAEEEKFMAITMPPPDSGGLKAWLDMCQFVCAEARVRDISPSEALVRLFIEQATPEQICELQERCANV